MKNDSHFYKLDDGQVLVGQSFPFNPCSETIKGSNISAQVESCVVNGGTEDCVDFVRGGPYTIRGCTLRAGAKTRTFITAKGGIDGLLVKDVILSGRTKWKSDIRLGDHTIYNKRKLLKMRDVVIDNVCRDDGKPVRVLVLDCEKPLCVNGKYKVVRVPKVLVWLFMLIKG